jgi:hypothetical protein
VTTPVNEATSWATLDVQMQRTKAALTKARQDTRSRPLITDLLNKS